MAGAETDAVVAGGGVVGLTTALALAKGGLSVALVEARGEEAAKEAGNEDARHENIRAENIRTENIRAWALAQSSWDFLYKLGLGKELRAISSPIWDMRVVEAHPLRGVDGRKLHVSHRDAVDGSSEGAEDVEHTRGSRPLGCIVEEHALLDLLARAVALCRGIRCERGLRVVDFEAGARGIEVMARSSGGRQQEAEAEVEAEAEAGGAGGGAGEQASSFERCFRAQLLLACDGRHSVVRERAGISCRTRDYGQRALVCALRHEREHGGVAVEWFMPSGTFASLPMLGRRSGIVWCDSPPTIERLVSMDASDFMRHVLVRFGGWLGDLSLCGARMSYPVSLSCAHRYISDRVALVGDSAHGIHPLAGQGLNLGLRDVAALAEVLEEGLSFGDDLGSEGLLLRYERRRRRDVKRLVMLTDGLQRLFGNDYAIARALRLGGMGLLGKTSAIKRRMAMAASGA